MQTDEITLAELGSINLAAKDIFGLEFRTSPIISKVRARQVLDSRGNPTVEVDVELDGGAVGRASVPSGASTGEHEALMMNIINGGAHSDAPIDFQEFMILPKGAPRFSEALRYGAEVFPALKSVLKARGLSTAVGDERGFAPNLNCIEDALDAIGKAVEKAGYKLGEDIFLALDAASSEFYDAESNAYVFKKSDGAKRPADELVVLYQELCSELPNHLDRGRLFGKRLGGMEEADSSSWR